MRKLMVVLVVLIMGSFVFSQAKEDKIREMLYLTGSDKLGTQLINAMIPQIRKISAPIPDDYWDKLISKINMDELIEMMIPLYCKYYTEDDIDQLLRFYRSDIGKKMIEVNPLMMNESMSLGQEWGMRMVNEIIRELKKDGYIKA